MRRCSRTRTYLVAASVVIAAAVLVQDAALSAEEVARVALAALGAGAGALRDLRQARAGVGTVVGAHLVMAVGLARHCWRGGEFGEAQRVHRLKINHPLQFYRESFSGKKEST